MDAKSKTSRPRPTIAGWLLALVAVICVLALVEDGWLPWSRSPSAARPVSLASRPDDPLIARAPTRGGSGVSVDQSGRMPIRVSIERAHIQVECASDSRVPIAIMERCSRQEAVRAPIP